MSGTANLRLHTDNLIGSGAQQQQQQQTVPVQHRSHNLFTPIDTTGDSG
jgi:hypothetical protein